MRILVTIPHFFRNAAATDSVAAGQDAFGSFSSAREHRLACLNACLDHLRLLGGSHIYELDHTTGVVGGRVLRKQIGIHMDILLAVHGDHHLVADLARADVTVRRFDNLNPKLLGFACHRLMAERRGQYDFYAFIEDDLVIHDPDFFAKQRWFRDAFGPDGGLLQPNRYEIGPKATRVYVDGDLPAYIPRPAPVPGPACLSAPWGGREATFERRNNPLSGCFILSAHQLETWADSPVFHDQDQSFIGVLESAQILGPMKLFPIYKPSLSNAAFLEIRHADARLSALPTAARTLAQAIV